MRKTPIGLGLAVGLVGVLAGAPARAVVGCAGPGFVDADANEGRMLASMDGA